MDFEFLVRSYMVNRVGNIADFGHKQAKGFGKLAANSHPIFPGVPPGGPLIVSQYNNIFRYFPQYLYTENSAITYNFNVSLAYR